MRKITRNVAKSILLLLMPVSTMAQSLFLDATLQEPVRKIKVKEGFPSLRLQGSFATAWENTFAIYFFQAGRAQGGTITLVQRKEQGERTYLGFLTARHVLQFGPNTTSSIYKNVVITTEGTQSKITFEDQALNFRFVYPEISSRVDLGFVVISVPSSEAKSLKPVPFAKQCQLEKGQPLLSIGFPAIHDRPKEKQRIPIENPQQTYKRWSTGFYVGDTATSDGTVGIAYGTTLDSIRGSSGGPVLNSQAEIAGVMSSAVKDREASYKGFENDGDLQSLQSHSFMVDCQSTKNFANEAWKNFLKANIEEL